MLLFLWKKAFATLGVFKIDFMLLLKCFLLLFLQFCTFCGAYVARYNLSQQFLSVIHTCVKQSNH